VAAYTPYDLLRTLCERVGWPQETDKTVALEAIREWESMNIFGNLAVLTECKHPGIGPNGRCEDCKKQIQAAGNFRRNDPNRRPWGY
jgi:hypothetical protein